LYAAIALSSILLVAAARGDLWLDEIWSIVFARDAHSALDIFLRFHHDNNHPLNTLYLRLIPYGAPLIFYRLFSVSCGIGSLILIGSMVRKIRGEAEALWAVILTGTSFPLVLHFSEARGYSPAVFFALVSFFALHRNLHEFKTRRLLLFWSASILGILSHLTFIMVGLANLLMNAWHEFGLRDPLPRRFRRFFMHQGPPLIFFAVWIPFFMQDITIGGGEISTKSEVLAQCACFLLGLPAAAPFSAPAVFLMMTLIVVGVVSLCRRRDAQWPFFAALLLIFPFFLFGMVQMDVLYFRYFLVCFPFFYLLLSYLLGRCRRVCPALLRRLAAGACIVMIAGQTLRIAPLVLIGRGSYRAVLSTILRNSPPDGATVGSDHDFRNRLVIQFYAPLVSGGEALRYIDKPQWEARPPAWYIIHSQDMAYRPPKELRLKTIGAYRLVQTFPFSGLSGFSWFLFKREPQPEQGSAHAPNSS